MEVFGGHDAVRITPEMAMLVNIIWMGPIIFQGLQEEWSTPWALFIILQIGIGYKIWRNEEKERDKNAEMDM